MSQIIPFETTRLQRIQQLQQEAATLSQEHLTETQHNLRALVADLQDINEATTLPVGVRDLAVRLAVRIAFDLTTMNAILTRAK